MNNALSSQQGVFDLTRLCKYFAELSPQPMVAVEGETFVVRGVNKAFAVLVNKAPSEMIGHPFAECVPEGDSNGCLALMERVFESGSPEVLLEQNHTCTDVVTFWSYSMWAILGDDEKPAGVMIQVTDASEVANFRDQSRQMNQQLLESSLKQHELGESLQKATLAKNEFLATMSHEIRTPLSAVLGFADLLMATNENSEDKLEYYKRMQSNGLLLSRLIDDILDLSKVEAGKLQIEKIETNLQDILCDTEAVMRHRAAEKGIAFKWWAVDPLPATIESDPTRLRQILSNIVGNAIKFTTTGEVEVTIRIQQEDKKILVQVKDSGEGISPLQAEKLFKAFVQADASTTRKYQGTGLGLSLSRQLARALGGDVKLVESSLGGGSLFEISVALESPKYRILPLEALAPIKETELRLDGIHILLAEDAPDNQLILTRMLTHVGALVEHAYDGEEAIEKVKAEVFDLILMDIQMPNMGGQEATMKIRENGFKGPIIAQSAHAMGDEVKLCFTAGCNGHIAKPVVRKKLIDMIHSMVFH